MQAATLGQIASRLAAFGVFLAVLVAAALLIHRRDDARGHVFLDERWLAVTVVALWYVAFNLFFPDGYGDEYVHQRAIVGIYDGDWSDTRPLSMIPGYHYLVAVLSELTGPNLLFSRSVTTLMSLGMLLIYDRAAKARRGPEAGRAALALALLPILLPFSTAVYTDAPSMLLIAGALWALTARRYHVSALLIFLACFVRQSNLIWAAFLTVLAGWDLWKEWRARAAVSDSLWKDFLLKICLPRLYSYALFATVFLLLMFALTKGLIWGDVPLNRARLNVAQLYTLSFVLLLLWAPVWLNRFRCDALALKYAATSRPIRAITVFVLLVGLAAVMVATYDNFHPWNQYWYYLRNNPLVLMAQSPPWRVVGVLAVFWTAWTAAQLWRAQPSRVELGLVGGFTVLSLIPQALVEPRYFIVPFALLNVFLVYPTEQERRLLIWWAILCAMICAGVIVAHFRYTFIAW
jgi:hypothetical protein